jgi:hypothetical protein
MAEIEESKQKMDANLKRRVDSYKVISPLLFFMSLLLMLWGGIWLMVAVCLRVAIITRYSGYGVWVFAAFWGTLLSPLQQDQEGDEGRQGEGCADIECVSCRWLMVMGHADQTEEDNTIMGLEKKYRWCKPKAPIKGTNEAATPEGKCSLSL